MKNRSFALCLLAAGLLALVPLSSTRAQEGGDTKTPEQLEIEALRLKTDALAVELAETKKALETIVTYLDAQSQGAKAMEAVLAEAEKKGFAIGENWGARVVLLNGWREQLAQAQKDLPKLNAPKTDAKPAAARPARRN